MDEDEVHCPAVTVDGDETSGGCESEMVAEGSKFQLFRHVVGMGETTSTMNVDEQGEDI